MDHPITIVPDYVPHFAPGEVYMCEYGPDPQVVLASADGVRQGPLAVKPEIFKARHAVVLSPRKRNNRVKSAIVVPFSTKRPNPVEAVHVTIPAGQYAFLSPVDQWIKADLIEAVSLDRLAPVLVNGRPTRTWLTAIDLRAVKVAVLFAIEMGGLAPNV